MADHLLVREEPRTDWQRALAHIEDNYKLYIAGAVFVLVCMAIGVLIRLSIMMKEEALMTRYADAALTEDPIERLEKYEALADNAGRWTPEVLYRMGETAIEAGRHDVARTAFLQLLASHANSDYVLHATDGLAFLEWNEGNLDEALAGLEQIVAQWPNEFIARRKHYDIGQIQEERGAIEAAISAYRRQTEVFPDSAVAQRAQQALDRLRETHPDLFDDEPDMDVEGPVDVEDMALTPYISADPAVFSPSDEEETDAAPAPGETEAADAPDAAMDVLIE